MTQPDDTKEPHKRDDPAVLIGGGILLGIIVVGLISFAFIETVREGWWAFLTYNEGESSTSELVQRWGVIFAAIFAGVIAIWRAVIADRARDVAHKEHLRAIKAGELSDAREVDRQDFDRFQRGAIGLGSDNEAVRIAAIATLRTLGSRYRGAYTKEVLSLLVEFCRIKSDARPKDDKTRCPADMRLAALAVFEVQIFVPEATKLVSLNFRHTDFSGAFIDGIEFNNCDFERAFFRDTVWQNCSFSGAKFNRTMIRASEFCDCTITSSAFVASILDGVTWRRSKVTRTDFSGAGLYAIDFVNTTVAQANVSRANFDPNEWPVVDSYAWADERPRHPSDETRATLILLDPVDENGKDRKRGGFFAKYLKEGRLTWDEAEARYPNKVADDDDIPF